MSNADDTFDEIGMQLKLAKANGFSCLLCNNENSFSYNGTGIIICDDCGIVYHIHALKKIYK